MKKLAFALSALAALALLAPAPSSAQDETGHIGMFFDTDATVYEFAQATPGVVPLHVVVYEHNYPALYGYEFGYTYVGDAMISATTLAGTGPIDVGGGPGNHIVGLAAPMPGEPTMVITTLSVFVMNTSEQAFTLHGATPNSVAGSETPAMLLAGDVIVATNLSTGPGAPAVCAMINGTGVIASDEASWDQIKSMYR